MEEFSRGEARKPVRWMFPAAEMTAAPEAIPRGGPVAGVDKSEVAVAGGNE